MTDWNAIDEKLTTPAFFTTGEHHALFREMRRAEPVHWTVGKAVKPFWSITRYKDIVRVLDDAETFSSEHGGIMPPTAVDPTPEERHAGGYGSVPTHTDPPRHQLLRRPFNKHFSAPAIARLRANVNAVVAEIIGEVLPLGACDLVEDMVAQLPVRLVCEMMGVPTADRPMIRHYCAAFLGAQDPAYQIDGDELKTQRTMMTNLFRYMFDLAMERRKAPTDDFTSLVGNMEVDGAPMSERDIGWWCFSIVAAGLESTRNAMAMGFRELMLQPDQADRLRADPSLALLAAEEIVRWVTPAKHKFRVATRDCEVGGKAIAKGDWTVSWLVSANRDEEIFPDGDRFDVGRKDNPHLGFGKGEHNCLGRHLARMEMAAMLNAVLANMPDMKIAGDYDWLISNNHTGLKNLPVRFTPRRSLAA